MIKQQKKLNKIKSIKWRIVLREIENWKLVEEIKQNGRGTLYAHKNPTRWTKTGRRFDLVNKLLEKIRNGRPDYI